MCDDLISSTRMNTDIYGSLLYPKCRLMDAEKKEVTMEFSVKKRRL